MNVFDKIKNYLNDYKWYPLLRFLLGFLLIVLAIKFTNLNDLFYIGVICLFFFTDYTLTALSLLCELMKWLVSNHQQLKQTFLDSLILIFMIPILSFLAITISSYGVQNLHVISNTNGNDFLALVIVMAGSIILMFLMSLLSIACLFKLHYGNYSYDFHQICLKFLVSILFTFIIGINSVLSESLVNFSKTISDAHFLMDISMSLNIELSELFKVIIYWFFTLIMAFQTAHKTIYELRVKYSSSDNSKPNSDLPLE